jgi:hypothetical protein
VNWASIERRPMPAYFIIHILFSVVVKGKIKRKQRTCEFELPFSRKGSNSRPPEGYKFPSSRWICIPVLQKDINSRPPEGYKFSSSRKDSNSRPPEGYVFSSSRKGSNYRPPEGYAYSCRPERIKLLPPERSDTAVLTTGLASRLSL